MKSHKSHLFQETLHRLQTLEKETGYSFDAPDLRNAYVGKCSTFMEQLGVLLAPARLEDARLLYDEAAESFFYGVQSLFVLYHMQDEATQAWMQALESLLQEMRRRVLGRKKVVVLTITAGNGHRAAAFAIEAGLHEYYGGDYLVSVHDIQADIGALYESAVKHSTSVYNWFFENSNSNENVHILHTIGYPMFAKKLDQIFFEEQPDLIVSTFSFPGMHSWIKKTLRGQDRYIPYITVITDSISIHYLWLAEGTDAYIVANEETKRIMVDKGCPEDSMKVLGFPVHPRFYTKIDVAEQRQKEGLDPHDPLFLLSVGTGGSMKDVQFLTRFARELGDRAQIVVVLGKNTELLQKLKKKNFGPSVKLLGWVGDMDRWMKMADVMVTKAGGATVMECVAVELPMIITRALAWQESGNVELIERYNLGTVLGDKDDPVDIMRSYVEDPERARTQRTNFAKLNAHRATERVVGYLKERMDAQ